MAADQPVSDNRAYQDLTVEFDGPGTEDGWMDARDFANSLLAMADLFDAVNQKVNPDGSSVTLKVKLGPGDA
jgi:hypothetical protein